MHAEPNRQSYLELELDVVDVLVGVGDNSSFAGDTMRKGESEPESGVVFAKLGPDGERTRVGRGEWP